MSAAAVLVALVAAMFVALQSASAANCALNPGLTLGFNQSCDIDVAKLNDKATGLAEVVPTDGSAILASTVATTDTEDADTNISIVAGTTTGTRTVNLTAPDDTNTPADDDGDPDVVGSIEVTVVGFAIAKVEVVGDTDNVVSAGKPVTVRATIRSADAEAEIRLTVPTTGLSIDSTVTGEAPTTSQVQEKAVPDSTADAPLGVVDFVVNTAGAPAGDYVLTFTADNDGDFTDTAGTAEADKRATETLTLTIGEPGTGLASATLSLGNSVEDLPFTDADESKAETGSDVAKAAGKADGKINLVVEAFDSLGGKANSSAINQIIVIAPKGTIATSHKTGAADDATAKGDSSATLDEKDAEGTDAVGADGGPSDVGQKTVITVSKTDMKPGTVTVYAIVSGPGGAARTGDVTLTFSGPAASLSIADATESLLSVNTAEDDADTADVDESLDTIKLLVTAEDSGGNIAPPPTSNVSIVLTDPDGKRKGRTVIERSQPQQDTDGKFYITLTGMGTKGTPLTAGNWTLTAKHGKLEATAMFAVAGPAANIALTVDDMAPSVVGQAINFTAKVTDKDGNEVADGTEVTITASDVRGDGDSVLLLALEGVDNNSGTATTKDGMATGRLVVIGDGSAVVTATSGAGFAAVVITSTAGAVDAEPERTEPRLSDFGNGGRAGYDTYGGPDTTMGELFRLLRNRGATALWLNTPGGWELYSAVDGAMVPGSEDLDVYAKDVLYITY